MPDVATVESSPTPASERLATLTGTERQEWLNTGKLPEVKKAEETKDTPKPEESAPSTEVSEPQKAEPAAEPEAAHQEPIHPSTKKRIDQLLADRREERKRAEQAIREAAELKARLEALERSKSEVKAESPAAESKRPAIDDVDEKGLPKFKTWDEYNDALMDWKADQKLQALKSELKAEQQKAEQEKQAKAQETTFRERLTAAQKKYQDFAEVAFDPTLPIYKNSPVDQIIRESDHGAEILYYLGKNREELDKINALTSDSAKNRELVKIELKFQTPAPVSKTKPTPPPPPTEVSARATAPEDPMREAISKNDMATYRALMDARDRKKG